MWAINLGDLNTWLDVAFSTVEALVFVGLIAHFLGGMLYGRFRKQWLEGVWLIHDGHPTTLRKIMHVTNLTMFLTLIFTGLSIRFEFFSGSREIMRYLHYIAMTVVIFNYLSRVRYAFFGKNRDFKNFAIRKADIMSIPAVVMYYIYLKPTKPHVADFNVLQKIVYNTFAVMIPLQAYTGLCLIQQNLVFGYSPRYLLTAWWAGSVGGVAMAAAWMRTAHYTFNWLFIVMVSMHAYLAFSQDAPAFWNFFGFEWRGSGSEAWKERLRAQGKPIPEQPDAAHEGAH